MKVYISIPITGRNMEDVKAEASKAKSLFEDAITKFEVCSEENKSYSYYMGRDIEELLECDAIYLCKGWQNSKGCQAEYQIAKIYDKQILIAPNASKKIKGAKHVYDLSFVPAEMREPFKQWLEYKSGRKESYKTEKSIEACYKRLVKLSGNNPETASRIIEQSMANNWAGLFELKDYECRVNKQDANRYALEQFMRDQQRINEGESIFASADKPY